MLDSNAEKNSEFSDNFLIILSDILPDSAGLMKNLLKSGSIRHLGRRTVIMVCKSTADPMSPNSVAEPQYLSFSLEGGLIKNVL